MNSFWFSIRMKFLSGMKYHFGFMYTENELKIENRKPFLKPCSQGRVAHAYLIWRERERLKLNLFPRGGDPFGQHQGSLTKTIKFKFKFMKSTSEYMS